MKPEQEVKEMLERVKKERGDKHYYTEDPPDPHLEGQINALRWVLDK